MSHVFAVDKNMAVMNGARESGDLGAEFGLTRA